MICGNRPRDGESHFKHRSSSYITEFFQDCETDYEHDGSTRNYWVADTLAKILKETSPVGIGAPGNILACQVVGSSLLELKVYDDKVELFLHDPTANIDPSWLWRARWVRDLPFVGPQFEVEAIANPAHLAMSRDKGVYRSAEWAIHAIMKHVAGCVESEKIVQEIVRANPLIAAIIAASASDHSKA